MLMVQESGLWKKDKGFKKRETFIRNKEVSREKAPSEVGTWIPYLEAGSRSRKMGRAGLKTCL